MFNWTSTSAERGEQTLLEAFRLGTVETEDQAYEIWIVGADGRDGGEDPCLSR
jgi:hypothetical protein